MEAQVNDSQILPNLNKAQAQTSRESQATQKEE